MTPLVARNIPIVILIAAALGLGGAGAVARLSVARLDAQVGQDAPPSFKARTDLVVLHAIVKDRRGKPVTGLPREAFTLYENGQPRSVEFFSGEDAPVTVGLLVDNSGSMFVNRPRIVAAAEAFVRSSHPQDEVFALTFNDHVRAVLPEDAPFVSEAPVLRNALARGLTTRGRTALFDGILAGLDYLERGHHDRQVLIIISDGRDNASRATDDEMLERVRASDALIYTVALVDPIEMDRNPKILRRLADGSGGESFTPKNANAIDGVLRQIAADIRSGYTLGFAPAPAATGDPFRELKLRVHLPDGASAVVRTRAGYLAGGGSGTQGAR